MPFSPWTEKIQKKTKLCLFPLVDACWEPSIAEESCNVSHQSLNHFGNLGTWKFGIQKMRKIKNLKIQIRSAQNVGKVWISRKKILPAPFGAIPGIFSMDRKKTKKAKMFPIFLGGWAGIGMTCWACCRAELPRLRSPSPWWPRPPHKVSKNHSNEQIHHCKHALKDLSN